MRHKPALRRSTSISQRQYPIKLQKRLFAMKRTRDLYRNIRYKPRHQGDVGRTASDSRLEHGPDLSVPNGPRRSEHYPKRLRLSESELSG